MKQLISRLKKKKKKTWGELSQENNPLYQVEIYSSKYQFVVNLT